MGFFNKLFGQESAKSKYPSDTKPKEKKKAGYKSTNLTEREIKKSKDVQSLMTPEVVEKIIKGEMVNFMSKLQTKKIEDLEETNKILKESVDDLKKDKKNLQLDIRELKDRLEEALKSGEKKIQIKGKQKQVYDIMRKTKVKNKEHLMKLLEEDDLKKVNNYIYELEKKGIKIEFTEEEYITNP